MDTSHWPQLKGVEVSDPSKPILERRGRPLQDQPLNCPRCNSTTNKFCYYNNYSLSQPRYFCKACKRYWTEGGSLRNVPVGGGSRKSNKRPSSSSTTSASSNSNSSKKLAHHHHQSVEISQNPNKIQQGQDLNLAYPPTSDHHEFDQGSIFNPNSSRIGTTTSSPLGVSAMELLKSNGINASRGLMSSLLAPISNTITMFSTNGNMNQGFPNLQDFKPSSLGFSLDGYENGYGSVQGVGNSHDHHARMLFLNADQNLKQIPSTTNGTSNATSGEFEHNRGSGDHSNVYWNGMLGGGSW